MVRLATEDERMPTTTYRIEVVENRYIETESAFVADLESRDGSRVTAVTEGDE